MGLKDCRTLVTLYKNKNLSWRFTGHRALIAQEIIKLSYCITVKMQKENGMNTREASLGFVFTGS